MLSHGFDTEEPQFLLLFLLSLLSSPMYQVPPKARISCPPILAYNNLAFLNSSTDMEITTFYSAESISVSRKLLPSSSNLPPEPEVYRLYPQSNPLDI